MDSSPSRRGPLSPSSSSSSSPSGSEGTGSPRPRVFVFGELEFDEERWELRQAGRLVDVPPKVMQTLGLLIRNRERLVSTEELISELWPGVTVTDASLTKAIRIARQVLGDDGDAQRFIRTTRGRGYRFVAEVVERSDNIPPPSTTAPPPLPIMAGPPGPPEFRRPGEGDEPFVGREAELSELNACLERAVRGRPSFLLLSGDAGVGKTRLVEVFTRGAELGGARVVWGRSCEEGGAPELWPWIQILRGLLDLYPAGTERDERGEIERLVAGTPSSSDDLGPVLPPYADPQGGQHPGPNGARSHAERFRVFDAVATLLRRAARHGVLVLILEDLHAADAATLSLTRFLAREIREGAVVLLGTYRRTEAGVDVAQSAPFKKLAESTRALSLNGLSEAATGLLLDASLAMPLSARILARVHQVTEGNPFFVAEVVRQLGTVGAPPGDPAELDIPERVAEAIRVRFDSVPVGTRELLSVASVIGKQFELPVLERVVGCGQGELTRLLEPAVLKGVVTPLKGSLGTCQFTHMLLRDVLYQALSISRRAELHGRTGEVLEGSGLPGVEPPVARLAHHFLHAALGGGSEKAVKYASAAGRQALRSFAFEEASRHFEHALDALRFASDRDAESTDLLLSLGAAERLSGDYIRAREVLDRALVLARGLRDPVRFARVTLDYACVLPESGEINQALILLLEESTRLLGADSEASDSESRELRSLVDARLATCVSFAGRTREGEALSQRALGIARSLERPLVLAHALHARHWLLWRPGTARERLAIASEIVKLERPGEGGLPTMEARLCEITDLLELGRAGDLWHALSRYARVARSLRDPSGLYNVRVFETMRSILEGRFQDAERQADEALPIGLRIHPENARIFYGSHLWWTRVEQGRGEEIESIFRARVESQPFTPVLSAGLLRIYVEMGATPDARRELGRLLEGGLAALPDDWSLLPTLAHVAAGAACVDDRATAVAVRDLLTPHAESHVVLGPAIVYLGPVSFYLGLLALTLSSLDDAIERLEHAVAEGTTLSALPIVARASLALAQARAQRGQPGDRELSVEHAASSLLLSRELGMANLERRARDVHERAKRA